MNDRKNVKRKMKVDRIKCVRTNYHVDRKCLEDLIDDDADDDEVR